MAIAGPHKPLCDKVKDAELVFEMRFEQKGNYPVSYREKQWAPPMGELQKTARTGTVSHVFKGAIKTGAPWVPEYGIGFTLGSDLTVWDAFFTRTSFSGVFFLVKKGMSYRTTGFAEESAGCSSSAHWSWCAGFEAFKTQVRACGEQGAPSAEG